MMLCLWPMLYGCAVLNVVLVYKCLVFQLDSWFYDGHKENIGNIYILRVNALSAQCWSLCFVTNPVGHIFPMVLCWTGL